MVFNSRVVQVFMLWLPKISGSGILYIRNITFCKCNARYSDVTLPSGNIIAFDVAIVSTQYEIMTTYINSYRKSLVLGEVYDLFYSSL